MSTDKYLLSHDEHVLHELLVADCGGGHVERVGSAQRLVSWVVHYSRWQRVKTDKIRHLAVCL